MEDRRMDYYVMGLYAVLIVVMAWLGGILLTGLVAAEKGRKGGVWLLVALAVTPLLALIALAALPDGPPRTA
jgi:hypothetical protein